MPKRLLDRCAPDSIREFQTAARQRFDDAHSLAGAGRRTAAVYLWGYAAEMTLKAAYFGAVGFHESQSITLADLRAAAAGASILGVAWPGAPKALKLHDLRAWAALLVATRASIPGLAYPDPAFGNQVALRATRLQPLWSEVLRYHKNVAYLHEVNQVRAAVTWLLLHASEL